MGHVFHLAWYMNGTGFGDSSRTSVPKIMASDPPVNMSLTELVLWNLLVTIICPPYVAPFQVDVFWSGGVDPMCNSCTLILA